MTPSYKLLPFFVTKYTIYIWCASYFTLERNLDTRYIKYDILTNMCVEITVRLTNFHVTDTNDDARYDNGKIF